MMDSCAFSLQQRQYTTPGFGCRPLLQCLGQLSLLPLWNGQMSYKLSGHVKLNGDSGYSKVSHQLAHCSTLCSKKSDAKIQINITTAHLIRINYPLSSFNYRLSGTNVANCNKIHQMVSEHQLFLQWNLKTEFSNMENTD